MKTVPYYYKDDNGEHWEIGKAVLEGYVPVSEGVRRDA